MLDRQRRSQSSATKINNKTINKNKKLVSNKHMIRGRTEAKRRIEAKKVMRGRREAKRVMRGRSEAKRATGDTSTKVDLAHHVPQRIPWSRCIFVQEHAQDLTL
jgi:hypothetical protein